MSGMLPLVRGGATALYPVTRRLTYLTDIAMALNATEQRSKGRAPLTELVLPYSRVSAADLATFKAFFESQKGPFDSTWGLVLGRSGLGTISSGSQVLQATAALYPLGPFVSSDVGSQAVIAGAGAAGAALVTTIQAYTSPTQVTLASAASTSVSGADARWGLYFPNMTLQDQNFSATEEDQTRTSYSFTLTARQTKNPGATAGSPGGTFPTITAGVATQFPYIQMRRFQVMVNDNPVGPRYSWTWFGGSLSGFPSGSLRAWELHGPMLSDADLATWEAFYRAQWGRWGTFTMIDPEDASSHPNCRFDSDVLEIQHVSPNINSTTLRILETN